MTIFNILGNIFIGPLKLIFEIIFELANRVVVHPGLAIIVLSILVNILALPLYKRADVMQKAAREVDEKLAPGIERIKRAFKGDERMMMLQTYYRQNNYKPTQALNGSVSLLLQIPFFTAAYQFLSNLKILDGVSFGPIKDLSAPDGLIVIGGIAINILPVIMTSVNLISSAIYAKGSTVKMKVQLYGMALIFLVLLYTSPSGLVFYWTLNNLFSLVKTIFFKLKHPREILRVLTFALGLFFISYGGFIYETTSLKRKVFFIALGVALMLPLILALFNRKGSEKIEKPVPKNNRALFFAGTAFLAVLVGVVIPTTYIAASPQEYVDITYFHNPLWYVASAASLAVGIFMVWMGVFYWLASPKGRVIFDRLVWAMCGVTLVNYMFFGRNLGFITSTLQYENGMVFELKERIINTLVVIVIALAMYLFAVKWHKAASFVLITAIVALGGMSVMNMAKINTSVNELKVQLEAEEDAPPRISLSKDGENVVILMLDRAMGEYVPYIFNEKPELAEKFEGFTFYENTISHGGFTNFGIPGILGGYEYTPVEMNKRDDELLKDKHNESILVMPEIFSDNGFDVTLIDPVYVNYKWSKDLSLFEDYPEYDIYTTWGKFTNIETKEVVVANNTRNFFCFSAMKVLPVLLQPTVYDKGEYIQIENATGEEVVYTKQVTDGPSKATGIFNNFMGYYETLRYLPHMTTISEGMNDQFTFMTNSTTHEPMILQMPDLIPAENVDNTEYDASNPDRFILEDGRQINIDNANKMAHYLTNMAALTQIANWLDYLRAEGVYDNTKIILVSDHGRDLKQIEQFIQGETNYYNLEYYLPLLMVKDFDSNGTFETSSEFMTNADVPTIAFKDLVENPVNPFTGKVINNEEKTAHDQFIIMSTEYDIDKNNGTQFMSSRWASVKENIWDMDNWTIYDEKVVIDEYAFPDEDNFKEIKK